jgi:LmbE family N-acetylglucosaminyl deacetylase
VGQAEGEIPPHFADFSNRVKLGYRFTVEKPGGSMALRFAKTSIVFVLLFACSRCAAQSAQPVRVADERYKADILLVVAHPDDEGAATPYLARAMDEGKRVAVVYGTRGSSGGNEASSEQAEALGDVREIEARRALGTLGITNAWFLGGRDTASQNVLQSLANWGHGAALEQLVRIIRLTRPEVILTFLPGTFIGEDHGDHQAAGVLAAEAFDIAGDSTVFPEQVAGPTKRLEVFLENLRPWQVKKIYYFPDADNDALFAGLGPEYSVKEISKSSKRPYWRMALESFREHQTQAKSYIDSIAKMDEAQIEKMATGPDGWGQTQHFVLGKSLVVGSATSDIFEGIAPGPIVFSRPAEAAPLAKPEVSVELAGPWSFYADFRRAHGLAHLPHPEPPEIALEAPGTIVIPLWLRNQTAAAKEITLTAKLPAGWIVQSGAGNYSVPAKQVVAARVEINFPALAENEPKKPAIEEVSVRAESGGETIGAATVRVERRKKALPQ